MTARPPTSAKIQCQQCHFWFPRRDLRGGICALCRAQSEPVPARKRATAMPKASKLPATSEAQWQQQVLQLAHTLGWSSYHTRYSMGSDRGFPDLVLYRERLLISELKSETGRVSPAQATCIARLRAAGQEVYLWRPSDLPEVVAVLQRRVYEQNTAQEAA